MHFFHQYLLYMTFEVAEPACHALQAALRAAATIDQVRIRSPPLSKPRLQSVNF